MALVADQHNAELGIRILIENRLSKHPLVKRWRAGGWEIDGVQFSVDRLHTDLHEPQLKVQVRFRHLLQDAFLLEIDPGWFKGEWWERVCRLNGATSY